MNEQYSPQPELNTEVQEIELHNQVIQLPEGQVLHSLDETRAQGFNGTTLAEIVLPTSDDSVTIEDKKLGIIDFGDDIPAEGRAILFYPDPDKPRELPGIGVTRTRFGIVGLNYHPEDLFAAFLPLKPGSDHTIGRSKKYHDNYVLGLSESGHDDLSRTHATISVDKSGKITIEDHSTNGTKVILPKSMTW